MFRGIFLTAGLMVGTVAMTGGAHAEEALFIGSKACAECHEEQYENYSKLSKKAHSWDSIAVMKDDLKPQELQQCYECHTTGYGKPGGFVSYEQTPHLADVGCETCHGPGSIHADTAEAEDILLKPEIANCMQCHSEERIGAFGFKPLMYSGAH